MKKTLFALLAASLISFSSWANDGLLRSDHPQEYTVKKGDTLWDISGTFLNTPWMWPEIWHVNPQIENPHLIYPGDVIRLIYLDGAPRLTLERTVKLAPGGDTKLTPSVRVLPREGAIPAIPLDRVDSFLSRSRIVGLGELEAAPYILAGGENRLVVGAGDRAYGRGDFSNQDNFGVFRQGETYKDPVTKEVLGVHAMSVGMVGVRSIEGDIATLNVVRANEEIRLGDRLLPSEDRAVDSIFYPNAPDALVDGSIIAVEGGVTQVGKMNVVVLNRGEREGLQVGNVLAIFKKGGLVRDRVTGKGVQLPDERAGLLMVFRTFEKMSFGLVLEADRPLSTGDKIRNP